MRPFNNANVKLVFEAYPPHIRHKLLILREIIFETAATLQGVGELEETLKWGEPAYLTAQTKTGSTLRIDWKKTSPQQYAMYFNCQTNLIDTFRTLFPSDFKFEGNRAIIFNVSDAVLVDALAFCIAAALTYHCKK